MDFSWLSSLGGSGGGAGGGGASPTTPQGPATTGIKPEGYFGNQPVYQGVAANTGQVGGAGMGMTQGMSSAPSMPATQNSMSGGGSVGAGIADSFKAIGDMIKNYQAAKAYGHSIIAAQAPNDFVRPVLAQFSMPSVR